MFKKTRSRALKSARNILVTSAIASVLLSMLPSFNFGSLGIVPNGNNKALNTGRVPETTKKSKAKSGTNGIAAAASTTNTPTPQKNEAKEWDFYFESAPEKKYAVGNHNNKTPKKISKIANDTYKFSTAPQFGYFEDKYGALSLFTTLNSKFNKKGLTNSGLGVRLKGDKHVVVAKNHSNCDAFKTYKVECFPTPTKDLVFP